MPEVNASRPEAGGLLPPPVPADADGVELVEIVDLGDDQPSEPFRANESEPADATQVGLTPAAAGRVAARERALGLLYESEITGQTVAEVLAGLPVEPDPFARSLVEGVDTHRADLEDELVRVSRNWDLERMPTLDRAILLIGVFELVHCPEVPVAVVINEAVELAKRFSTDESGRFVNGVLSRLASDHR